MKRGPTPRCQWRPVGTLHLAVMRQHTLPQPEQCHRKPADREGLSNRVRVRVKMLSFQWKLTRHTKKEKDLKLNEKR